MKYFLMILICLAMIKAFSQKSELQEKIKFLALGDSYTIGESVARDECWPVQLINRLRAENLKCEEPHIIAVTGWRTDQLRHAINDANLKPGQFNLVSLLIGVNNQYQGKSIETYKNEFRELLKKAIELGGDKKNVFVVSIPDYGFTPFGESQQKKISTELDDYNNVNKQITEAMGVQYFYITDISRKGLAEPDLVAGDGLHPSAKMYSKWVDLIMLDVRPD
jgi:lysophospholipase L1-like esterase